MTNLILNSRQLNDLDLLLNGSFHPLSGFMKSNDYLNVLNNLRLSNGEVFSLPIVLSVTSDFSDTIDVNDEITLCDKYNYPIAKLNVEEIYQPNIELECTSIYNTIDDNHPYMKMLLENKTNKYIGGKVTAINGVNHFDFSEYRKTPQQLRELFKEKGWDKVVAFQTRNPMHRSHYELTKYALRKAGSDAKLLIHPVVGITQECDIDYYTRVKCYKKILSHYEKDSVELSLLNLSMRMAGPREALLHAIIRKNHGCTHFIIGRDHAGPSYKRKDSKSFFGPYDAQELVEKYSNEIGITLIKAKMISYVEGLDKYLPADEIPEGYSIKNISGTQQREMLRNNVKIPEWFTFPEIAKELEIQFQNKTGLCIYLVGLSGSGKTTIANYLKNMLMEKYSKEISILDGDVIRHNLSKGLGFSRKDRSTNVRRIGYVASEIVKHSGIVICANIAPYDNDRVYNRNLIEQYGRYIEILVDTPLKVCERRDIKGLYKLARLGKIKEFTGISDPFEKSSNCDLEISGIDLQLDISKIMELI